MGEYLRSRGEADDPLGEDAHSPVPGLVHRYPDRVLLLVTNFCSVYCRYCTRARMVGSVGERSIRKHDLEQAIDYIAGNPVIRDVLLSGGDPLKPGRRTAGVDPAPACGQFPTWSSSASATSSRWCSRSASRRPSRGS